MVDIKLEPLNMHGHANTWEEELQEVIREHSPTRDQLAEGLALDASAMARASEKIIELRTALADLYDYPAYPLLDEGMVSEPEDWEAQARWREGWESLETRVLKLLGRSA